MHSRRQWLQELHKQGINVSDSVEEPIDILLGADVAGRIITGEKMTHIMYRPQCEKNKRILWHTPVDDKIVQQFNYWVDELPLIKEISILRWMHITAEINDLWLYSFCDVSSLAYVCVTYLRTESTKGVYLHFIQARNTVTSLQDISIPSLELLAATIGARLGTSILNILTSNLNHKIGARFWSDSSTAIAWMKK
ncbi:hypothetical protein ILUMI_01824 [Ignelater luminosus]|uniref:Uncharacterized protein n=1 Tax=Ignelater luminosus TaxID=2038154 RepID=A0A8K0GLW6_IGNLU|nr:hypothetical protein ILUMI_01824 [Ignelater luminosus]